MTDPTRRGHAATRARLLAIHDACLVHFGPRHWWPADTPLEVCVGAILTQNTAWANVAKALANLKAKDALSVERLHALPVARLAALIRPSGYFNQKADRLKGFVRVLVREAGGSLDAFFDRDTDALRARLLAMKGIGEETADSILLYAAGRPRFVVDAYTKRIFHRKGMIAENARYADVQAFFERHLPPDVALYNEYHAQIVALGHHCCRPTPRCDVCPVRDL
jgi:endonuclease-3 related protein